MDEDDRLDEILWEWRKCRDHGETVDPEEIIRRHPEMAGRLRRRFLAMSALDELFEESVELSEDLPETIGRYRLRRQLGVGGMGRVFLASTEDGEQSVALKVLHPHLLGSPGFFTRFKREAEIGLRIRHENVVRTLDIGKDGEFHFLAMEYVEGRTLRDLSAELGCVPESLLREIALQVAAGLIAIHDEGIVHRDLKPENLIITRNRSVRIMDLGVARLMDTTMALTREGQFAGSLLYASPEQFSGADAGPEADLYSLGVLLLELATGRNPFRHDSVPAVVHAHLHSLAPPALDLNPEISPFFSELIGDLLVKDPARRPDSAAWLHAVLIEGEHSDWWGQRSHSTKRPATGSPRIPVRRETVVLGRDTELAVLTDALSLAGEGEGGVVLIEGEAGIGKTRLVDEFLRRIGDPGVQVLYGSYSPSGGLGALSEAVLGRFGEASLADSLNARLTVTSGLVPAFAANIKRAEHSPDTPRLSNESLHAMFCHLAHALAAERTTVWVIEDLHFGSTDSRSLALSLARAAARHRLLVIATTRPGMAETELTGFGRLDGLRRMPLGRLSPREVVRLLRHAFRSDRLADRLGAQIAYKSDGVPFFIFEMIRGLIDDGYLTEREDGSFEESRIIDTIEVPSAVRDLIGSRLRDLSREERAILDAGAVQGFEFDPGVVALVRGLSRFEVLETLAHLERRSGIVRGAEGICRFDHHQIQEVLYQDLPRDLRAEYHAAVARALAVSGEDAETNLQLALHHLKGATPIMARPHVTPALEHLGSELRHGEALDLARRALSVEGLLQAEDRVRTLLHASAAYELFGRIEEERAALEEAVGLAQGAASDILRARTFWWLGAHLVRNGNARDAERFIRDAVDLARAAGDDREEADALRVLGVACQSLGRYEEAKEHDERAIETSRRAGDPDGEAGATINLGIVLDDLGRKEEAREHLTRGRRLAREAGNRLWEASAAMALGSVLNDLGEKEEAQAQYHRDLAFYREIGYRWGEAVATGNLGSLAMGQGRLIEALARYRHALDIEREIGRRGGEGADAVNLGRIYLALGDAEEAERYGRLARQCAQEAGDRWNEGFALHLLAGVARRRRNLKDAAWLYEGALRLRRELPHPPGVARTLLRLGATMLTLQRRRQGIEFLLEAAESRDGVGPESAAVLAVALLAVEGEMPAEEAAMLLAEAMPRMTLLDRMEAEVLLYRVTGGPKRLRNARDLLRDLVNHAPEEYREQMVREVPLYREIG